ncbi:MAG TPA: glycosyltransferase [Dehalococcoidia bacterium]|nr:glycosyltransferase [Dehalococcoidia bacterium]
MTEPSAPRLTLVVPAYNEENRIAAALARIATFLTGLPFESEVIVVDDGSAPAGRTAALQALDGLPAVIGRGLIRHDVNRGKGAAVRSGCMAARGEYVAFIDADLATPPEDLTGLLTALEAGADVAIGIRRQPDGSDLRDRRNRLRRLAGYAYAAAVRFLLLPDIEDSQCPLKAFRRDAAQRLFPLQRIDTWAFDAELLYLARRMGLLIAKVPVAWRAVRGSHLRLGLRTALELWNLVRIRWMHRSVGPASRPSPEPP